MTIPDIPILLTQFQDPQVGLEIRRLLDYLKIMGEAVKAIEVHVQSIEERLQALE